MWPRRLQKNANDQLRAMKDVQDYLRAQTDSLRKLEAELVRKAREQQSQGAAKAEEPVAEPQKTAAITPAPAEKVAVSTEQTTQQKDTKTIETRDEKPKEDAAPKNGRMRRMLLAPKAAEPVQHKEEKQEPPKPKFERPAERLARRQGGVLRATMQQRAMHSGCGKTPRLRIASRIDHGRIIGWAVRNREIVHSVLWARGPGKIITAWEQEAGHARLLLLHRRWKKGASATMILRKIAIRVYLITISAKRAKSSWKRSVMQSKAV